MAAWNGEVNVTAIDGVPVVWADAPGPMRANLMFRVGRADELLPWGGITHLVEHLTLFHLGPKQRYEFNGGVTANRTMFYAQGEPAEIVEFLGHVTSGLQNLPMDRLESEKSVLLAEASSRPLSAGDVLFGLRYGARGPGLHRYKEMGLYHLPPSWVAAWAARSFSRDNAVLMLSGAPPADLRLPLAAGERMPGTPAAALPLRLPAYAQGPVGGAGVSMVAPRTTALAMASAIASERLLQSLRYDKGIAYSVGGGYFPLNAEVAHVSLWTDAQAGQAADVLNGTVQAVYVLGSAGPTTDELASQVSTFEHNLARDDAAVAWLDRTAVRILNGEPVQRPAELVTEMRAVTVAAAREAMAEAVRTAIYLAPGDVPAPPGIPPYAAPRPAPVEGHALPHVQARLWKRPPTLTVGPSGVTMWVNANQQETVRFESCEALLRYPDGGVCLVGHDGAFLPINPAEWTGGAAAVQQVSAGVPPVRVVSLAGETTPTVVEVPQAAARAGFAPAGIPLDRWIALFVFVAVAVALLGFVVFGNRTSFGSGPPFFTLVAWGALAYRIYRRFKL